MAHSAGVSVGLLYKYFPSKRAVVLSLYDDLSAEYARRGAVMESGKWRNRFLFALQTSLDVLRPHRETLLWLLDKTFRQRAASAFIVLLQKSLSSLSLALHIAPVRSFVCSADDFLQEAIFSVDP